MVKLSQITTVIMGKKNSAQLTGCDPTDPVVQFSISKILAETKVFCTNTVGMIKILLQDNEIIQAMLNSCALLDF